MNLTQIKAYLESKRGILACQDYEKLLKAVDFNQIESLNVKADSGTGDYGLFYFDQPALSIENETATIKIRGLLMPDVGWDLVEFGLTGYDVIEHYLHYANNLQQVKQIVLDIDSGGGYSSGLQQCADVIMKSNKPIRTFASGDMYSAAYWLGCSSDNITATPYSGIGSIGAYAEHFDCSKQLENQGIVARIFRSGKWKGAFGSNQPLTEEEQARLQQDIDAIADEFFTHVAQQRRVKKNAVASWNGDSFTAEQALEKGLIDRIENVNHTEIVEEGKMEKHGNNVQAKALTADQLEQIKIQAREEAKAELKAQFEREKGINALQISAELKQVLASEAFASVTVEAMSELVKAMPKSFSQAMDEGGGAGVEADPQGFAPKTKEQAKLDEQQAALAKLNELTQQNHKGL